MSLRDLTYRGGQLEYPRHQHTTPEWVLPRYLEEAREILRAAGQDSIGVTPLQPKLSADFEGLRWFPLPGEDCSKGSEDAG
jgi:hypothetical protein